MPEGYLVSRDFAARTARAVRWVEQNQGGLWPQAQRAHKNRARTSSDAILTVTHIASSGKIVIEQNGWVADNATPWQDYTIKIGNLVNETVQISDTFEGTFMVAAYVQQNSQITTDPLGAGLDHKIELVQNAEAESVAAGSDHYVGLSTLQMGVYTPPSGDIAGWYAKRIRTTLVPLAMIKVVQEADSSSAGPSTPGITVSMISRAELVSHLHRMCAERSFGWAAIPTDPFVFVTVPSGLFFVPQNTSAGVSGVIITITGPQQPFTGYAVVRWRNVGATPNLQVVGASTADLAANYGDSKTYNAHLLLRLYVDGGRLLDVQEFPAIGGTMIPSIRSPNSVTDSGNDQVVFNNGIQTGYTAQDSAL